FSDVLLAWYDANARVLPWRIPPDQSKSGVFPDPYRVWLSEVMLQQTTVAAVKDYFLKFTTRWPTVFDLAAASDDDVMAAWAGLGYYARARNLLKCAGLVVDDHDGQFPQSLDGLLSLPGIGPYTGAAIASIAFGHTETVVDGNVERVMARLFDIHHPLPGAKAELTTLASNLTPDKRPGDYAQAVMDLGATVCTPKSPKCDDCPLANKCLARANGSAKLLPKKTPKPVKPTRFGLAYIALRGDGSVYLERRPGKGLLGGMMGWPGPDWTTDEPTPQPPFTANWRTLPGDIKHTFTHFHLVVRVMLATDCITNAHFTAKDDFDPANLPTVMRKMWLHAKSHLN
ncbi:MAG: A/G-specific adenine glycosylase, partial [Planktomarina sp.]